MSGGVKIPSFRNLFGISKLPNWSGADYQCLQEQLVAEYHVKFM